MNPVTSKVFKSLAWLFFTLACIMPVKAQLLDLNIVTTPALATTNDVITFEMELVNNTGGFLNAFQLNVSFSESVEFVSATNVSGTANLEGSEVVYTILSIDPFSTNNMSLQIVATEPGILTNYFDYFVGNEFRGSEDVTKVIFSADADLAVSIISPTNTLVARDWITYRLMITNQGPDTVDSVVVTTEWPPDTDFISSTPAIASSPGDDDLVFTTPALPAESSLFYDITIQPNTPGSGEIYAEVYVNLLLDRDPTNDQTTNTLNLGEAVFANLDISLLSAQILDPQTGLMTQSFRLTNNGTTNIPTARIMIDGFPFQIMSAAGTNSPISTNGVPFVTLTRPLGPSESADFLLEYFIPSRTNSVNPTLTAFSVPQFVPVALAGDTIDVDATYNLDSGNLLIEFTAEAGKSYFVIYSDDVTFANSSRALPAIGATANRVQWIDAGPPKTSRHPTETAQKFYKVIEIPD